MARTFCGRCGIEVCGDSAKTEVGIPCHPTCNSKPEVVAEQERRGDLYDAIARSVEAHGPAEVLWILGVILDDCDPDDPLAAPIAAASSSCFAGSRAITGAAGAASDPEAERVRREALYGVLTRRSIL